ncbi:MAG: hypothetical protein N2203_06080, partial [Bacteroidia bacterium]|nr:hypothetical protein [Bacteroidia bacterium]
MTRWKLNTLLVFFLFFISKLVVAQNYGNEWINSLQTYWKFPIYKQGIYRIDSATLANAGVPLQNILPQNLQIFLYGEEQYIYIKGEQDGVFNSSDYLEFYAELKPYLLDSLLYTNITALPNPYIGVCSAGPGNTDTVYAFITYNTSTNNKRLVVETDTSFSSYIPENYVYTEQISVVKNNYNYIPQYTADG